MRLINDYKNMGGRVTVGTDSGFIWKTYGFAYIEELELMREAGFLPLEIIRSATMYGARTLYEPKGEPPPIVGGAAGEGGGGGAPADRRGARRDARRSGAGAGESAEQPQGALRHRASASE